MNEKVVYNREERIGQIFYFCEEKMFTLEYESYLKSNVIMVNIPSIFEDVKKPERERILNFIGKEVAQKQSRPSYYKITETSIEVHRRNILNAFFSWQATMSAACLLLIAGLIMLRNNIVLGKDLPINNHFKRTLPMSGGMPITLALILFVDAWFKRKKIKKASTSNSY